MEFGLSGWGGQAVVAALVVATNLAPTAGVDGLADYTGAAACALATGPDMPDSACRAGAQATDRAAADTATESAATTGHDPASGATATAPTGVVADRRPADCPSTSRAANGQGADDAGVATTVDEARDEDGGSDRRRRDTHADDAYGADDGPAPRHPPVVHAREDDEQDSSGDDADTPRRARGPPRRRPRCPVT